MLDGAARLDELVAKAVADGQPALGITDHGNMYGALEFYKECRAQGIKPVIGTEAYMAHDHRSERPTRRGRIDDSGGDTEGGRKLYYHLTLLAENDTGYRNLIHLASKAFLEGYYYKPRLDWELLAQHSAGLIATTGCLGGHVLQSMLQGDGRGRAGEGRAAAGDLRARQPVRRAAGPRRPGPAGDQPPADRAGHQARRPAAGHQRLPLHPSRGPRVPRRPAVRADRGGAVGPQAVQVRGPRALPQDRRRDAAPVPRGPRGVRQHVVGGRAGERRDHVRRARAAGVPAARRASPTPTPTSPTSRGRACATAGATRPESTRDRVQYELDVIAAMGFSSYFLIVWDLIKHARDAGIRVGPGRGSAAGCAVAYALRITDLDPIRYDLLFERFLNPSRISMPDIDMDFDSRYRDEMIRYAAERYGRDHVAQIITFGTIKARNAVPRRGPRCSGFPYGVGDRIAKAMPPLVMGRDTPLKYCFEQHPKYVDGYKSATELRAMYDSDPDVKKVVDVAKGLEGLKRSDGIHAAAVVITKEPLTEYLPVQRKPEPGQPPELAPLVTQYEMHGVEELGLLKMDFLGLRNLDVISDTVAMLRAGRDADFDIDAIALDDGPTLELLQRGAGIGVFQLEGAPLRALMKSLKPTSFGDVAALVALYRPGPMAANMHNDYADRKNGRKPIEYIHPDLEEILADTYGLMIYQESVMRVAQKIAGYSLAEADLLRKAMGKKSREVIATERAKFVAAAEATGYGATLGHTPVRHHRAVRRLRVQQEPRLRLRPRRLPDRLPQGPLPGRVLRRPADERQELVGAGRHLHRRMPGDGDPGAHAGHQPLGHRLRRAAAGRRPRGRDAAGRQPRCDHVRALRGAQRRRRPRRPAARRARGQRSVHQLPRLRRAGPRAGAQQARRRVADPAPGRSTRSATRARACSACSSTSPTPRSSRRRERERGVMSLFGDWGGDDGR